MTLIYPVLAFLIGALFATQTAINSAVARILGGSVEAASLSVFVTFWATCLYLLFSGNITHIKSIIHLPWWSLSAGLLGACVLIGSAWLAPITGVAFFIVCLVAGQMFGAVIIDQIGAFGMEIRQITSLKFIGILLTCAGVLLVRIG